MNEGGDTIQIDILRVAAVISALSVIFGAAVGGYKLFSGLGDRIDALERKIRSLEQETEHIKREDALVIFALRACLDGLQQKGCNGRVTEAIRKIDKYINQAAHDQD